VRRTASTGLMFSLALLLAGSAAAQDAFLDQWRTLRSANPAEVSCSISAKKATFFLGEMTPLQLTCSATQPNEYMVETQLQDAIGRLNYEDEFRIAGDSPTEDPLRGLQGESGGMGGLQSGPVLLSDKPFTLELALNEWVRLRSPGTYRLYVITHRVSHVQQPLPSPGLSPRRGGNPVTAVSNVLTIEVLPAPDDWVKNQIAAATKILDRPVTPADSYQERANAGRVLSFLNTREAAVELARRLGDGRDINSVGLHRAVLGSPFRSELLPFMQERLVAPDQPVWDQYLETIAHLAELVDSGGPLRPYPQNEQERATWQEESKRRAEVQRQKRDEYVGRLIDSLPTKQPEPRAVSLTTLINIAVNSASRPIWYPRISAALVANFRALPSRTQSEWLESRWDAIKGPEMIPVLREIYNNAPLPRIDPPADELALRRLYELAPAEGKRLLLAEIEHPTRFLRWTTRTSRTGHHRRRPQNGSLRSSACVTPATL
jgi:hypothetical protein